MGTKRKVKTIKARLAQLDANLKVMQAQQKALEKALAGRGDEEIVDADDVSDRAAVAGAALDQTVTQSFGARLPAIFVC